MLGRVVSLRKLPAGNGIVSARDHAAYASTTTMRPVPRFLHQTLLRRVQGCLAGHHINPACLKKNIQPQPIAGQTVHLFTQRVDERSEWHHSADTR